MARLRTCKLREALETCEITLDHLKRETSPQMSQVIYREIALAESRSHEFSAIGPMTRLCGRGRIIVESLESHISQC